MRMKELSTKKGRDIYKSKCLLVKSLCASCTMSSELHALCDFSYDNEIYLSISIYVILKLWNPSVDHIVLLLGPDLCPVEAPKWVVN